MIYLTQYKIKVKKMKEKLRVLIDSVILLPHIVTFVCLKMSSGGGVN